MAIYSLSDNRDVSAHSNFAQNLMHHACNAEYNVQRIIFDPKILNTLRFFFCLFIRSLRCTALALLCQLRRRLHCESCNAPTNKSYSYSCV